MLYITLPQLQIAALYEALSKRLDEDSDEQFATDPLTSEPVVLQPDVLAALDLWNFDAQIIGTEDDAFRVGTATLQPICYEHSSAFKKASGDVQIIDSAAVIHLDGHYHVNPMATSHRPLMARRVSLECVEQTHFSNNEPAFHDPLYPNSIIFASKTPELKTELYMRTRPVLKLFFERDRLIFINETTKPLIHIGPNKRGRNSEWRVKPENLWSYQVGNPARYMACCLVKDKAESLVPPSQYVVSPLLFPGCSSEIRLFTYDPTVRYDMSRKVMDLHDQCKYREAADTAKKLFDIDTYADVSHHYEEFSDYIWAMESWPKKMCRREMEPCVALTEWLEPDSVVIQGKVDKVRVKMPDPAISTYAVGDRFVARCNKTRALYAITVPHGFMPGLVHVLDATRIEN